MCNFIFLETLRGAKGEPGSKGMLLKTHNLLPYNGDDNHQTFFFTGDSGAAGQKGKILHVFIKLSEQLNCCL